MTEHAMDAEGRRPGAPAWNGDVSRLSPAGLQARDDGLCRHIANLTVRWRPATASAERWTVRPGNERQTARFDHWVAELVKVRNEQDRREHRCGGVSNYRALIGTPAWDEPWGGA